MIVSQDLLPDFTDIKYYQEQLKETFNHEYNVNEIQDSLDLLLGQQQEPELLVYPDQHIQGI